MRAYVAAMAAGAAWASAGVVYDNITGNTGRLASLVAEEMADDTTLEIASGDLLDRVEVAVLLLGGTPYQGSATLNMYADGGGAPGTLLTSVTIPLALLGNRPQIIEFDFADFAAPSASVWTGIQFALDGGQTRVGFLEDGLPTIGATSDARARRNPDQTWMVTSIPDSAFLYRIHTVPGCGAGLALGAGMALWRRRR